MTELKPDHSQVPGVIINHLPASLKAYVGSPSLVILPDGKYVASHDHFGPGTDWDMTSVFHSQDGGCSWERISILEGQWWSSLFLHRDALYILGTTNRFGRAVIRRSTDGGVTWTSPVDENTGLLSSEDRYHCAPMPVVEHNGYLWRGYELARGERPEWEAQILSASSDADLLQASNWRFSEAYQHLWSNSQWIEGNVVVAPDDTLVDVLRTNPGKSAPDSDASIDRAAIIHIAEDGFKLSHDPDTDLIDFPGGGVKFTVRYDERSKRYWSLGCKQADPPAKRNSLFLTSSFDLITWEVMSPILHHQDPVDHAFQYVDWVIEGDDMLVASRTAYDDGLGGAHRAHDANYLTFHRIENFGERSMSDPPLNGIPGTP